MKKHTTEIIQVNEKDQVGIRFEEGKFQNFLFTIGQVEFSDPDENDQVRMSFQLDIVDEHNLTDEDFVEFQEEVGDFIIETLENQIEKGYNGDIAFTGGV